MQIARVEAEDDARAGGVRHRTFAFHRPGAGEPPLVERERRRRGVPGRFVRRHRTARKMCGAIVPDVRLRRLHVAELGGRFGAGLGGIDDAAGNVPVSGFGEQRLNDAFGFRSYPTYVSGDFMSPSSADASAPGLAGSTMPPGTFRYPASASSA